MLVISKSTIFVIAFVYIISNNAFCQIKLLKGSVRNIKGEYILGANVNILDSLNHITNFSIAYDGFYSIELQNKQTEKITIQVSAYGYFTEQIKKSTSQIESEFLNFVLTKDSTYNLQEVVILAKKNPFEVTEDTVKFKVDGYRSIGDQKVEDILLRIPGFEVNTTSGEIKYRGKSIETLLIDGDNLLSRNYSIASKNVNLDIVEEIQAIENYNENPILKGIESSNKVAVNLKLKQGSTDFSGSANIGIGSFRNKVARDLNTNILAINSKSKTLALLSNNNTGEIRTPFDYLNFESNPDKQSQEFRIDYIIPEQSFVGDFDPKRLNRNDQSFANLNSIYRLSKKLNLKVNTYFIQDDINNINENEISNLVNGTLIETRDIQNFERQPLLGRLDFEIKYIRNKRYLIEFNSINVNEKIKTTSTQTINELVNLNSNLTSKEKLIKNQVLQTFKIDSSSAIQFKIENVISKLDQNLNLTPEEMLNYLNINQSVLPNRISTNFDLNYFRVANNISSSLNLNFLATDYEVKTGLLNKSVSPSERQISYLGYKKKHSKFSYKLAYKKLKWNFETKVTGNYLNRSIENSKSLSLISINYFLEPELYLKFRPNNQNQFTASFNQYNYSFSDQHLLTDSVFISNRNVIRDSLVLTLSKSRNIQVSYLYEDLFSNSVFKIIFGYQEQQGNYFPNYIISDFFTVINQNWSESKTKNFSGAFLFSKFFQELNLNFKFSNSITLFEYGNFLNSGILRRNQSISTTSSIFIKTAFSSKINLENSLNINNSLSKGSDNSKFENIRAENTFKLIGKLSSKWFFITTLNTLYPEGFNTNINFVDATIRFRPLDKKYSFSLIGKNLLDKGNININKVGDFYSSRFRTSAVNSHIVLHFHLQL